MPVSVLSKAGRSLSARSWARESRSSRYQSGARPGNLRAGTVEISQTDRMEIV